MKKTITIICIALSAILILDSLNAGHALVMFFLVGIIPGTNLSISAETMLELFMFLGGLTLSRVVINVARSTNKGVQSSTGTMLSAQS